MLEIQKLHLYLKKDMRVLIRDFNFVLGAKNRRVALIGEEGNGKSTLLKAIYDPKLLEGYAELQGEIHRSGEIIGYLPQIIGEHWEGKSAAELVEKIMPSADFDYRKYYRILDQIGLSDDVITSNLQAVHLSGGEKIKFALLLELLREPTLLLLDEPSNDLDLDSLALLEQWILNLNIPLIFVSHDERLLERCADTIVHFEQLVHKTIPVHSISGDGYRDYVEKRKLSVARQNQQARKDKELFDAKMERYRHIYEKVQHKLRTVSRQSPSEGKALKDKMHTVKAQGRRFEKEKEKLTQKRIVEDSIDIRFDSRIAIPNGKEILNFRLPELWAGERLLARNVGLRLCGAEKVCVVGSNGAGKTTLLRKVMEELENLNIRCGYMPQQYADELDMQRTPIDFLTKDHSKEENTRIRTYLGSLNFTAEEMQRPIAGLSGGQKAKLYFSKMLLDEAQFLILDEPTRNLSPLSGPEIRKALKDFGGGILAVSHDRAFIEEVFERVLLLDANGLTEL